MKPEPRSVEAFGGDWLALGGAWGSRSTQTQVPLLFASYNGMGGRLPDFSIYSHLAEHMRLFLLGDAGLSCAGLAI